MYYGNERLLAHLIAKRKTLDSKNEQNMEIVRTCCQLSCLSEAKRREIAPQAQFEITSVRNLRSLHFEGVCNLKLHAADPEIDSRLRITYGFMYTSM